MNPAGDAPYHRLGAGRAWWKPLVELLLVVVWWFLAMGVVFAVVFQIAHVKKQDELDTPSSLMVTLVSLAILTPAAFGAVAVMGRDWRTLLSVTRRIRWRLLARCVVYAFAIEAGWLVFVTLISIAANDGITAPDWGPFLGFCALVIVIVPFQAAAEEMFFRGIGQQVVGAYVRWVWAPIVLSAIGFMFAHGHLQPASASIFAMGLAYAWLAFRTGGLESGIAHHTVNNVLAFMAVAANRGLDHVGVAETNGRVSWVSVVLDLARLALYVWLVTRLQRRLAERALAGTNQIEQHAAERSGRVEHADHGGHAEPLPPEQQ